MLTTTKHENVKWCTDVITQTVQNENPCTEYVKVVKITIFQRYIVLKKMQKKTHDIPFYLVVCYALSLQWQIINCISLYSGIKWIVIMWRLSKVSSYCFLKRTPSTVNHLHIDHQPLNIIPFTILWGYKFYLFKSLFHTCSVVSWVSIWLIVYALVALSLSHLSGKLCVLKVCLFGHFSCIPSEYSHSAQFVRWYVNTL